MLSFDDGRDHGRISFDVAGAAQIVCAEPVAPGVGFIHELCGAGTWTASFGGAQTEGTVLGVVEHTRTERTGRTGPGMPEPRTLAWWVEKLVDALAKEPATALRIRQVAGQRRARVGLDDESVIVEFGAAGQLLVRTDDPGTPVDGEGRATRAEVCAILAAKSDASEAVLSGRVSVRGPTGAVAAMLHAIEILLDSSARIPLLRELADEFVASTTPAPASSATAEPARPTENEVLAALDLLP